jgi:hypothetical protein
MRIFDPNQAGGQTMCHWRPLATASNALAFGGGRKSLQFSDVVLAAKNCGTIRQTNHGVSTSVHHPTHHDHLDVSNDCRGKTGLVAKEGN